MYRVDANSTRIVINGYLSFPHFRGSLCVVLQKLTRTLFKSPDLTPKDSHSEIKWAKIHLVPL